ncbi:hypothetical protein RUM44_012339 [Polyplax serrata]|uniref:Uncharacterized protein n=1 Tax=Polyplax serrata TaxID=468196 RepID=A0ABR1BBD1_POLSC
MSEENKTVGVYESSSSKAEVWEKSNDSKETSENERVPSKDELKGHKKGKQSSNGKFIYKGYETLNNIKKELLDRNEVLVQKTFAALKKRLSVTKTGGPEKGGPTP